MEKPRDQESHTIHKRTGHLARSFRQLQIAADGQSVHVVHLELWPQFIIFHENMSAFIARTNCGAIPPEIWYRPVNLPVCWLFDAGGVSLPKQLAELLSLLSRMEEHPGLGLHDNPWEEPPEAVVKKGMTAVSQYFADLFAEGAMIRRNMIKVVLVGQEGAGKTRFGFA